jgi:hypothetical protein
MVLHHVYCGVVDAEIAHPRGTGATQIMTGASLLRLRVPLVVRYPHD